MFVSHFGIIKACMKAYIDNLKRFRPLMRQLVIRNIKVRYRKSILGVFWTLLNPLLIMIVLSVVFSNIFKFEIEYYPVYILSGQVVFNFFSEATNFSMMSILSNAPLIKKIYVPKYTFPFAAILSSIINVMASFAALVIIMVFMRMPLHWTILLSFIPIIFLIIISTGVGLMLSAFAVKFRDLLHFYSVFLTALMYLMPVIYPMSIIQNAPVIFEIVSYNPLTIILDMFRDLVMYGCLPDLISVLVILVICLGILVLGLFVFCKKQDKFILDI